MNINLSYENRLHLNKDSGSLIHVSGEGYFIVDEYGREVNTFVREKEFNRLIDKFKYRQLVLDKLNLAYQESFEFGEDNILLINDLPVKQLYWNLPKNESDVNLYFNAISMEVIKHR